MTTLYVAGEAGAGCGWCTCLENTRAALAALGPVKDWDPNRDGYVDGPLLSLLDIHGHCVTQARGAVTLGWGFFEWPLTSDAAGRCHALTYVLAGSSWNQEVLARAGVASTVACQGVNPHDFPYQARSPGNPLRLFSGGKLEYRKGQDIVLAAFAQLAKRHPDLTLVTAWNNPWPHSVTSLRESPYVQYRLTTGSDPLKWLRAQVTQLCQSVDLDPSRVEVHGLLRAPAMAALYASTDLGLFPNRGEAGTNLVLMEYCATGRPTVATVTTGHQDLVDAITYPLPPRIEAQARGWDQPDLQEVVDAVEMALDDRADWADWGRQAAQGIAPLTWEATARSIQKGLRHCGVAWGSPA